MQEKLTALKEQAISEIQLLQTSKDLFDLKTKYLGKTGEITSLLKGMKDIPAENRSAFGKMVNDVKQEITLLFDEKEAEIKEKELKLAYEKEAVDVTLDGISPTTGNLHPLTLVRNKIIEAFSGMAFYQILKELINYLNLLQQY